MNQIKLFMLAVICASSLQAKELTITSRINVEDKAEESVRKELNADSRALTRKYADADGVRSVETSVETTRCDSCGGKDNKEETKCACNKPKPKSGDIAQCDECEGHTQTSDKVEQGEDGSEVCSDCKEVLRSCSKCCKKKCCKKCKKCCNKCSSCTSSSSSSCCH